MDLVLTAQYALDLADQLTGVGGFLVGGFLKLFTNDVQPLIGSVLADFAAPTYTGYAPKVVTWSTPSISDDGDVEVIGTFGQFRPTDGVTPNTVFGALYDQGGTVVFAGRFDEAPLPMESAMDAINITVRFRPIDQSIAIVIS